MKQEPWGAHPGHLHRGEGIAERPGKEQQATEQPGRASSSSVSLETLGNSPDRSHSKVCDEIQMSKYTWKAHVNHNLLYKGKVKSALSPNGRLEMELFVPCPCSQSSCCLGYPGFLSTSCLCSPLSPASSRKTSGLTFLRNLHPALLSFYDMLD